MKYIYFVNSFQYKTESSRIVRALERASDAFHRDYEIRINRTPEEAFRTASYYKDTENVITALGGDGSLNHLVNIFAATRNILAILPLGTGNDFYRTCKETMQPGLYPLDLVRINHRHFINTACFGIDAAIANDEHFIHNPFIPKPLRYHAGVVYHFLSWKKGRRLTIHCQGQEIQGDFTTVIAANGRYYGGGYKVSPDSLPGDGKMEVYVVDKLDRLSMAKIILSMKDGGHLTHPALTMFRTRQLSISSPQPFAANIDGEPIISDHFDLELIPKGIRFDYNKAYIDCFLSFLSADT